MDKLNRRTLFRTAALLAVASGARMLRPLRVEAARCPKLPKSIRNRLASPVDIQAENGLQAAGLLDLTTVSYVPDKRNPTHVSFEFSVDSLELGKSIQTDLDTIHALAHVDGELHRPPICLVSWDGARQFGGIAVDVFSGHTMLLSDGTPVRGTAKIVFQLVPDCEFPRP